MFTSAIAINEFQCNGFEKIAADISEETFYVPGAGHGHPPVWIMGHLALTAESGMQYFGRPVTHREWTPIFGPGSPSLMTGSESFTKRTLQVTLLENYQELRRYAAQATAEAMEQPHRIPLFRGTPIKTIGDCITLLLTNHFGFHLSQLSSCRRAAGFAPLF